MFKTLQELVCFLNHKRKKIDFETLNISCSINTTLSAAKMAYEYSNMLHLLLGLGWWRFLSFPFFARLNFLQNPRIIKRLEIRLSIVLITYSFYFWLVILSSLQYWKSQLQEVLSFKNYPFSCPFCSVVFVCQMNVVSSSPSWAAHYHNFQCRLNFSPFKKLSKMTYSTNSGLELCFCTSGFIF